MTRPCPCRNSFGLGAAKAPRHGYLSPALCDGPMVCIKASDRGTCALANRVPARSGPYKARWVEHYILGQTAGPPVRPEGVGLPPQAGSVSPLSRRVSLTELRRL